METVLEILMRRDELSEEDALELIEEVKETCLEAIDRGEDPEEVFMDMLGLEPDYLFDIL